jgi:hypothetical protein
VPQSQAKLLPDEMTKRMDEDNYKKIPIVKDLKRKNAMLIFALGGQVSEEGYVLRRKETNYKIQHRQAAYKWARQLQLKLKLDARKFLDEALLAMEAHENATDLTAKEVPEEITAFSRAALWRKSPEEWAQLISGQIATAREQIRMAQQFLDETTHIPCAIYSQV